MGYKHGAYACIGDSAVSSVNKKPADPIPTPPYTPPEEDITPITFQFLPDGTIQLEGITFQRVNDGGIQLQGAAFITNKGQVQLKGCV